MAASVRRVPVQWESEVAAHVAFRSLWIRDSDVFVYLRSTPGG